jgi:RimJ/RimL family protein N-acetyltransferase
MATLTGDYLELRPLPERDLPALLKVYQGTPLYFEALGRSTASLALADVRAQWEAARTTPGRTLFGAYHTVTGLLIGAAEVTIGTPEPGAAAVWLLIWGGFQRQGYGQECLALLVGWLAESHPGVESLWAIAAANPEGRAFLELQGFAATDARAPSPVGGGETFWMRLAQP